MIDKLAGAAEDGTTSFAVVVAFFITDNEITFADDVLIGLVHLS
jgi:hypothetical protein